MIARQSPWQSNAQNAQAFLLAKQKVLGQIIGKMVGVKSASVMLSMPEKQGFGTTYVRPSASVNVMMLPSKRVAKQLVEAIAGLVSGAVAEMTAQDVVVIDANRGRQFTVKSPNDVLPGEALELVQQLEHRYREKVNQVLSYIPGVIIAVNARVDPVHTKRIEEYNYEESEPLKSEYSRETERQDKSTSGEPGARPNTGLDIAGAGENGSFERTNESRNEFNTKNLTRRTHTTETGHVVKQVNVTINVPRFGRVCPTDGVFEAILGTNSGVSGSVVSHRKVADGLSINHFLTDRLAADAIRRQPRIGTYYAIRF